MTSKTKRARHTLEFKLGAVKPDKARRAVEATPGVADQTTCNGVKADRERRLTDTDTT
uniref:Transposase n=1 Tax=Ralstonia solanacearum TaxID=305 RepID=A0A0S4TUQ0_RALSL